MSKNLIPQIAEMLNVEIWEEFKVKGDNVTYKFTSDGTGNLRFMEKYGEPKE